MRKHLKKQLLIFLLLPLFFESCVYEILIPPDNSGQVISFQTDIIPIFNSSCNTQFCHASGGVSPFLTMEQAYNELWEGNYIDTLSPANSELYLWVADEKPIAMPPGAYDPFIASTILAWIEQGALDN